MVAFSFEDPLAVGSQILANRLILAPMAGVTDNPYRKLCKRFGAGFAISEMVTADKALYARQKSLFRTDFSGEIAPICAQIVGSCPKKLAQAARLQISMGAQIIDINMGCPAKKVYKAKAGSALLGDPELVRILCQSVVDAVDVPVTLKTRLGVDAECENITHIAHLAQDAGICLISIHGRNRADGYKGKARYGLIASVKSTLRIPVVANGDIDSAQKALEVQRQTGCDAIMIGRAAQGRPWIFAEIRAQMAGRVWDGIDIPTLRVVMLEHLEALYAFYGEYSGCRIARKHLAWYTASLPDSCEFRALMYQQETTGRQFEVVSRYLARLEGRGIRVF